MTSTTQHRDRWLWLVLAGLWLASGLSACGLALARGASLSDSGADLTLYALAIAATAYLLRWLPLQLSATSTSTKHAVWLLGTLGVCNWLGALLFRSGSLLEALPGTLLIVVAEVWLQSRALRCDQLPWIDIRGRSFALPGWHPPADGSDLGNVHGGGLQLADFDDEEAEEEEHEEPSAPPFVEPAEEQGLIRKSSEGIDERGLRFQSGAVRVQMAAEQTTDNVVVSYFPPFVGHPQVELEADHESVSSRIVHNTPTGMRISLRRSPAGQACEFWLQWYAVQSEAPSPIRSRALP